MNKTIKSAIKGIYYEWAGKRLQAIADLDVLIMKTVGVGDHTNIAEDIKKKYEEIDKYNSLLDTLIEQHGDLINKDTDDKVKEQSEDCCGDACNC